VAKKNDPGREYEELESAYYDMSGGYPTGNSRKARRHTGLIIGLCAILIIVVAALLFGSLYIAELKKVTILNNVTIAGVDVGGMTKDEAVAAVTEAIGNSYAERDVVVKVLDREVTVPAAYSGGVLDIHAAARDARNFGNVGTKTKQVREQLVAMNYGYKVDLAPYMQINEDGIRQVLQELGNHYNTALSQTTYEVTGEKPTEKELEEGKVSQKLVVVLGTPEYTLNLNELYQAVLDAYTNYTFEVTGECSIVEPDPIDLTAINKEHGTPAQNAYMNPTTYEIIDGKNGSGLDLETAQKALDDAQYSTTVTIDFIIKKPTLAIDELKATLFKDTLATATAKSSSQGGRDVNLALACQTLNGMIINPGQTFSYNEALGERTEEKGYKAGASYAGGQTVYTVGGGICQVSSTLYNCVLLADLEVVARENHGFAVSYLPLGIDATVSWGSYDFIFRNNTENPILIEASAEEGNTTITFKGVDDKDYYIKTDSVVLRTVPAKTTYKTITADNKEGYKDGEELVSPYTGYEVKTYRCKYDKKTDKEISRVEEAYSVYSSRDAVICKIEAPAETQPATTPTEPTATEPVATESSATETTASAN